jgi:hypothetical protein
MPDRTRKRRTESLTTAVVTYERARVVITPEAPRHYRVVVSRGNDHREVHAVERVIINTAQAHLDSSIWFVDAKVDVGVSVEESGETVWVWT